MVRLCVICGNIDGVEGVSMHGFPANAERKRQWVMFAEINGVDAQHIMPSSKLCSRHFVPGRDYLGGAYRRRLLCTAVPSVLVDIQLGVDAGEDVENVNVQMEVDGGEDVEIVNVQMEVVEAEDVEVVYVQADYQDEDMEVEVVEVRLDEARAELEHLN
ncbi:hypothetical protein ACI65C_004439 [Semiaphis heraclei]